MPNNILTPSFNDVSMFCGGREVGPQNSVEYEPGQGSADGTTEPANISVETDNGTYYGSISEGDGPASVQVDMDGPHPSKQ